jgi:hypothetical protein
MQQTNKQTQEQQHRRQPHMQQTPTATASTTTNYATHRHHACNKHQQRQHLQRQPATRRAGVSDSPFSSAAHEPTNDLKSLGTLKVTFLSNNAMLHTGSADTAAALSVPVAVRSAT